MWTLEMKIESARSAHIDTYYNYYLKVRPLNEVKLMQADTFTFITYRKAKWPAYIYENAYVSGYSETKRQYWVPVCISDSPSSLVDFLAGSTIQVSLFKLKTFSGIRKGSRSQNLYCWEAKRYSPRVDRDFGSHNITIYSYGLRSIHLMILNSHLLPTTRSSIHVTFTDFYSILKVTFF